jgi:hypothetical protein
MKVGKLLMDEKGSYFELRSGRKLRGKSMLREFVKITKPPKELCVCVDTEGCIYAFPYKNKATEIKYEDNEAFRNRFRKLVGISRVDTGFLNAQCSGVHL